MMKFLPNFLRYLIHLAHNPCNSDVHERDKWLLACYLSRGSAEKRDKMYERLTSQLDTAALVTTFMGGFSFLIVTDAFEFEREKVPKEVIIGVLGIAFVLSIATTLIAITVKTHVVEIGVDKLPSFFSKYSWTMSLIAHFIVMSVTCFMASGLMIIFNRFQVWIGVAILIVCALLFAFLAIINLELRDRSMVIMGFDFIRGQYTLGEHVPLDDSESGYGNLKSFKNFNQGDPSGRPLVATREEVLNFFAATRLDC